MNVVFISPHFPLYFHNFCSRLKNRGVNVLGIGDAQYSEISNETKESLSEYYRVNSLENYDEVYKAVAYYISKYGRIDFVESQNEYCMEEISNVLKTGREISPNSQRIFWFNRNNGRYTKTKCAGGYNKLRSLSAP